MANTYKNIEKYNPNKRQKILITFDDVIADMLSNKKTQSNSKRIIYQREKIKYFSCFYHTILFPCFKTYQAKFNTPYCYEKSKQKRTSTNFI